MSDAAPRRSLAPPSLARARCAPAWDGDVAWSFRHSPVAIVSRVVLAICLVAALFAPWIAPHNPFDLRTLNLSDALSPPAWHGRRQGRVTCSAPTTRAATCCRRSCSARASRCWSASRRSRSRSCSASSLGLVAGYAGGKLDAFIMRVADVQLSFPGDPDRAADRRRRPRGAAARRASTTSRCSC